jgi:hypothetical protein
MGLLAHQRCVAQTLSLQRRDSSRRRADIDMSVDAARKSARATRRLQGSVAPIVEALPCGRGSE